MHPDLRRAFSELYRLDKEIEFSFSEELYDRSKTSLIRQEISLAYRDRRLEQYGRMYVYALRELLIRKAQLSADKVAKVLPPEQVISKTSEIIVPVSPLSETMCFPERIYFAQNSIISFQARFVLDERMLSASSFAVLSTKAVLALADKTTKCMGLFPFDPGL